MRRKCAQTLCTLRRTSKGRKIHRHTRSNAQSSDSIRSMIVVILAGSQLRPRLWYQPNKRARRPQQFYDGQRHVEFCHAKTEQMTSFGEGRGARGNMWGGRGRFQSQRSGATEVQPAFGAIRCAAVRRPPFAWRPGSNANVEWVHVGWGKRAAAGIESA